MLLRHPEKLAGNTWGVPAGKLEKDENPTAAVIREIWEEVGIDISGEGLAFLRTLYCRVPDYPQPDFIYHQFHKSFDTLTTLNLALEENTEARWVTIEEALELPLITGGKEALYFYTKSLSQNAS
jgi:8-oxo-dGTP pyrophosphatase MutT (NUDIX family)